MVSEVVLRVGEYPSQLESGVADNSRLTGSTILKDDGDRGYLDTTAQSHLFSSLAESTAKEVQVRDGIQGIVVEYALVC